MAFADVLERVGSMGRFQVIHVTLLTIPILMMASHNLLQNFVAFVPPHHCRAPKNFSTPELHPSQAVLLVVPLDADGKLSKCQRYSSPQWHFPAENRSFGEYEGTPGTPEPRSSELQGCEDGWEYDLAEKSSTIISEWNLVCNLRSLKQMGQSIYMAGVLVGAVVFGGLADRFGRRRLLQVSYLLMAVAGTCAAFAASFSLFCLFRFLCGMALSGLVLNSFSLILEWIPTHTRTVVGSATGYCYTTGQLILVLIAYFVRDWRWLTLAVSLPFYIFFLYSGWFLESARWLVLNRKSEQAVKNLHTVARVNSRKTKECEINTEVLHELMKKEVACSQGSYSVIDLFRTSTTRIITVCLSAVWFSTSFAYYGLAMDLDKFGVDIYLIQVIFGVVDIPAKVVVVVSMSKIGRRCSQCITLILAGITILTNMAIPYEMQIVRTALAVVGKGCLAASFTCCYLYSGELYPTIIRQNGMGWVTMMARIGSMVAPMVLLMGDTITWLPGLIYGGAPIISGLFSVFLPETRAVSLPDTIQDVEERSRKKPSKNSSQPNEIPLTDEFDSLMK